jgi:hypothetical protein
VVDLGPHPQPLGERRGPDGHDHELLEVDVVVGVGAAVEHVHHRHRQHVGAEPAKGAVQGQPQGVGGRPGHRHRDAEGGVGAELGLVVGAVGGEHDPVDGPLVIGVGGLVEQRPGQDLVDVADRVADPLAAVAVAAVAELDGLELAGGGAGGDDRAAEAAVVEVDVALERGIAARVQDLPGDDEFDGGHGEAFLRGWSGRRRRRAYHRRRPPPAKIGGNSPAGWPRAAGQITVTRERHDRRRWRERP